ncbi:hypothetical protein MKW94_025117 [Papaver nudicaule]|uniref:Purple acid phosphatase n=1 Tax=Papaver nudicaule TaxID=74823 RepID=A0AA41VUA7_PAPNU|nr:hypothetical protein [Papaver nudicaule]
MTIPRLFLSLIAVFIVYYGFCIMNIRFSFVRPPPRDVRSEVPSDFSSTSPQQVRTSLVGQDKMRISWITNDHGTPSKVEYGIMEGTYNLSATWSSYSYKYLIYQSGEIHDVVIGPLKPDTVYYYRCGSNSDRAFNFKTPPAQFPIKFVVVAMSYDVMLLPGDLSYADYYQPRWDSFGQIVDTLASQRLWMVTQGNHEIEYIPIFYPESFAAYNARWHMPFEESSSISNLYYSFEVAGVHVVMLGSYTDFGSESEQYKWLQADLAKVDRTKHRDHQLEYASVGMKNAMEDLIYEARVDAVFDGHVHSYERFSRVYAQKANKCGPVHITIGDGGNREGLSDNYIYPQRDISVFREASFGHGRFQVVNETYASWGWYRNQDDEFVTADTIWLKSLSTDPACVVETRKKDNR